MSQDMGQQELSDLLGSLNVNERGTGMGCPVLRGGRRGSGSTSWGPRF
jgi:hypothetical protein